MTTRVSSVGPDGTFRIGKRHHQIPRSFSDRQIHSYRTLLEPIPDSPSGPSIPSVLRRKQESYLMRRSLAAVIPGLPLKSLEKLSMSTIRSIHQWIALHRPELTGAAQSSSK